MLRELGDTLNDTQRQWLLFMLERVGQNNLPRLLDYYESIGWISEGVAIRLSELADKEKRFKGSSWKLSAQEHRKSMFFIEKISGRHVDGSLLISPPGRVSSGSAKAVPGPRAGYLEAHQRKKKEFELTIQRREVTIKNLEQELEDREAKIEKFKEKIKNLEGQLAEARLEAKRNKIYREILGENLKLRRTERRGMTKEM